MKSLNALLLTSSLVLASASACAGHPHAGYNRAKVVGATPLYETVRYPVDEQICWDEQVWRRNRPSAFPTVAGAIIGGVVGNQFGHGDGRVVATAAGAAVGGVVGYKVARKHYRPGAHPVTQTRCDIQRNWRTEQRVVAWDVAYRYRGVIYHTRMPERPGKHIMVNVNVGPAPYFPGR